MRASSDRPLARALHALGRTALAALLLASGATAQTPEPAATGSRAEAAGNAARAATPTPPSATDEAGGDSAPVTPKPDQTGAAKPSKRTSEPFKPSERIEAESVVSFPEDI